MEKKNYYSNLKICYKDFKFYQLIKGIYKSSDDLKGSRNRKVSLKVEHDSLLFYILICAYKQNFNEIVNVSEDIVVVDFVEIPPLRLVKVYQDLERWGYIKILNNEKGHPMIPRKIYVGKIYEISNGYDEVLEYG
jgi:hypothetical protein